LNESYKIVFLGRGSSLFADTFCCKLYRLRLVTHNAQRHRQTDDNMIPIADHTTCSSSTIGLKIAA